MNCITPTLKFACIFTTKDPRYEFVKNGYWLIYFFLSLHILKDHFAPGHKAQALEKYPMKY